MKRWGLSPLYRVLWPVTSHGDFCFFLPQPSSSTAALARGSTIEPANVMGDSFWPSNEQVVHSFGVGETINQFIGLSIQELFGYVYSLSSLSDLKVPEM
jgi:hypothetical protein